MLGRRDGSLAVVLWKEESGALGRDESVRGTLRYPMVRRLEVCWNF